MNKYIPIMIFLVVILVVSSAGCINKQQIQKIKQVGNSMKNKINNGQESNTNSGSSSSSNGISTKISTYVQFSIGKGSVNYEIKDVYLSQPPRKVRDLFPYMNSVESNYTGIILVKISGKYPEDVMYSITDTPTENYPRNPISELKTELKISGSNEFVISVPIEGKIGETKYLNIWVKNGNRVDKVGYIKYKIIKEFEPLNTGIKVTYENISKGEKVTIKFDPSNYININDFLQENFNIETYQINVKTGTMVKVDNKIPNGIITYVVFSNLDTDGTKNEIIKMFNNKTYVSDRVVISTYTDEDLETLFSVMFGLTFSGEPEDKIVDNLHTYMFLQYIPLLKQYNSMYILFDTNGADNLYYIVKITPKSDINDILVHLWTTPISFSNKVVIIVKTPKSLVNMISFMGLMKIESKVKPVFTYSNNDSIKYVSLVMSSNSASLILKSNMKVYIVPPLVNRQLYEPPLAGLVYNGIPLI